MSLARSCSLHGSTRRAELQAGQDRQDVLDAVADERQHDVAAAHAVPLELAASAPAASQQLAERPLRARAVGRRA